MSALRIKNTSENDPHSYEAVTKKAQKKFWGIKGKKYEIWCGEHSLF